MIEAKDKIVGSRDWTIGSITTSGNTHAARYYYESILREYPQTAAARAAQTRLAEIRDLPDVPKNHFQWLTDMFERRQY